MALDLFITADENMNRGIFTFWAGSLHFFVLVSGLGFMHVLLTWHILNVSASTDRWFFGNKLQFGLHNITKVMICGPS